MPETNTQMIRLTLELENGSSPIGGATDVAEGGS